MGTIRCSVQEAADLVRTVDSLSLPLGVGQPVGLIHALGERTDWERLDILGAMLVDFYSLFDHPGVFLKSMFFGPAERIYRDFGRNISFIPADFRRFARVAQRHNARVVSTMATPPDSDGWMSLSLHAGANTAELAEAAADPDRLVIVETSAAFPHTLGLDSHYEHRLHVDEVDVICESGRSPVVLEDGPVTEVEQAIAAHAQQFIRSGATLQTGFGSIPSTIATALAESDLGDFGGHSEMFTTGLYKLHQAGKVTNARKGQFQGYSLATFAAGTPDLYAWLDGNSEVRFAPVELVNSPEHIADNDHMVTINGAISVDLWGQVTADSIAGHQFSGIGGHEDFVSGGGLQSDDRSLICLPATASVGGELVSRIVAQLDPMSIVTTPRHQIDVVITEFGAAELSGKTTQERAAALAGIAHPQFRDQLLETVHIR